VARNIPIDVHDEVKRRLDRITRLVASTEEPSVWVPKPEATELVEVNFIGVDRSIVDPIDTYERADARLPLMVFGPLALLEPGPVIVIDGLRIPLPRPAGLALEKLVTDRTGEKGDRDLLVVAGLLALMSDADLDEMVVAYGGLSPELRGEVRSNLSILSLLSPRAGMPDPSSARTTIAAVLRRLEAP
jgi:hypothetical protein